MNLIPAHTLHRRRAQRMLQLLQDLWGDDLPDGPEPELMVLIDAVAGDDHMGSQDGYVVQSDRLTYDTLGLLLQRCSTPTITAQALPRELLSRVFTATSHWRRRPEGLHTSETVPTTDAARLLTGATTSTATSTATAAVGTWRLDPTQQILSWDETCAGLLQRHDAPRHVSIVEELEVWTHPEDRSKVVNSFEDCVQYAAPHRAQFRTLRPDGGFTSFIATGQQIVDAAGAIHVVGILQPDN